MTNDSIRNHGTKGFVLVTSAAPLSNTPFCAIAVIGGADAVIADYAAESTVEETSYTYAANSINAKTIPKGMVLPLHGTDLSLTSGEVLAFLA